jgi:ubiquinone/menaquinone biosynthesis C-methylase UbiE
MERIPEPDLMNEVEQACAYAEADFAEPHNYWIELLQQSLLDLPQTGLALDLGCGPGDITIRFARAFPGWTIDGVDGAAAMLNYGYAAVQQAELGDRVQLVESYLPEGDAPHLVYDLISSNSLLHHLTDSSVLWQSIHRWSRPGTWIFIMDLMRPTTPAIAAQFVSQYAANEPEILQRDFYNSLLAAYSIPEIEAQLQQAELSHLSVKPVSDRHFMIWGRYHR